MTELAVEVPEKKVLRTTEPLGSKKAASSLSINATLNREVEKDTAPDAISKEENLPQSHFTDTDVQTEWNIFIEKIKDNFALKTLRTSKSGENEILINYPSNSAKIEFQEHETEFLSHFKHKVKNFSVTIIYKEDKKLVQRPDTKREKFNKFAQINPILKDLDDLLKFDFN